MGSFTAGWEISSTGCGLTMKRKKIDRKEIKREGTSLERAILGICQQEKLLDYIENFILYHGETIKIIAQNHQFIGVNKAIASFEQRKTKDGKAWRFLAHAGRRQELFHDLFCAEDIPQTHRRFHLCGHNRP